MFMKFLSSTILFFTFVSAAFATETNLQWNNTWFNAGAQKLQSPFFSATELEPYGQLPFFQKNEIVIGQLQSFDVAFTVLKVAELSPDRAQTIKDIPIPDHFIVEKKIGAHLKNGVAQIFISSLRRNAQGNIEQLLSFQFNIINTVHSEKAAERKASYKNGNSSILASGTWYKVKISASGIYKIDKAFLQTMGVNGANIDPRNIRVFGNGGGMLPERINTFTPDDLQENAIFVSGENDGVFNDADYALFYAKGPHTWRYDTTALQYAHSYNVYSDAAYYFITVNSGTGKRISAQAQSAKAVTHNVSTFDDYAYQESDLYNLIKSGRTWFGDHFNIATNDYTYNFSFPNMVLGSGAKMNSEFAVRSSQTAGNNVSFLLSGSSFASFSNIPQIPGGYDDIYAVLKTSKNNSFFPSSSAFSINMHYQLPTNEAECWLNYLEVQARRNLTMTGNTITFRDGISRGHNNVAQYMLTNAALSQSLWDITTCYNVKTQDYNYSGGAIVFTQDADTLKEYISFSGTNFNAPTFVEVVANQDIHGKKTTDYVIVCAPEFLSAAQKLAAFHTQYSSLDVLVVTPDQVYNEFSSGAKDVGAIRNMMRYFYKNASTTNELPKYLLLFGDGTYDYKSKITVSDFVSVYESQESIDPSSTDASDDFFGFLDDNEGDMGGNSPDNVDVGIGRIPCTTLAQADGIVRKIIAYSGHAASNNSMHPEFGNWRNQVVFVADDGSDPNGNFDYAEHVGGSEILSKLLRTIDSTYNHQKIYFDAYQKQNSAGGARYPDVETAIEQAMSKGALILSYIGHGGPAGWADERVLNISQINKWTNFNKLPFFVTATCEFSRFDDPQRVSAGEYVLLNGDGGAIGQLTTTRLVFGSSNLDFSQNFFDSLFTLKGNRPTIGQALLQAKTQTSNGTYNNKRKFFLMGDPAISLAFPSQKIMTTAINQHSVVPNADTLKALMKVKVEGKITNELGQFLPSFNGIIYPTVYDKSQSMQTLNNSNKGAVSYGLQNNILYKGKASVTNGLFSFEFIVPKDINYQYGNGKISYYAHNSDQDAAGFFENFTIGGTDPNGSNDNTGPEIRLFMNDSSFIYGGLTNESPKIFALVSDESGINTAGSNIGHDIVAMLDKQSNQSLILNTFYEADLDSYKKGTITYPLSNLAEGEHQLSLKVWDVNNNSSEKNTLFVVSSSAEMALSHVLNYPNPFTTHTEFWFEHNQASATLQVQIQIFSISGHLVKTINTTIDGSERYKPNPIPWDGKDDFGDAIGRGVYVYRLKVQSDGGHYAEKTEKLVILK